MSFGLPESDLTWDVVSKIKKDDDYWMTCKRQRVVETRGVVGSFFENSGRPYWVTVMYFLKGTELLVAQLPHVGADDFEWKKLVDLRSCSLMTQTILESVNPPFWSPNTRSRVWGERFFFARGYSGSPCVPAFDLEYPKRPRLYDWSEAVKFSQKLKDRIYDRLVDRAISA